MTLAELAARLGCQLEGDGSVQVSRLAGIDQAVAGEVTFLANPRYASKLGATRASAVIADASVKHAPCAILRTAEPYLAFAEAVAVLTPAVRSVPGIHATAVVDPTAEIGPDVAIGPFVAIGAHARIGARTAIASHVAIGAETTIGEDCLLHAHVSIREGVTIGSRVVLQNAAVIGSDGFGFARRSDGSHQKIPQVGRVVIEDDVEIGAHTAVDRPAVGETRIGSGTKIDNLVQVAHGVRIGRHALLAAQSGVAGSSELDDAVILAGQAGVTGHVHVGRGAIIGAKSVVSKDIEPAQHVTGIPAIDISEWRTSVVLLRRLPELRKTLTDLDARLTALESDLRKGTP